MAGNVMSLIPMLARSSSLAQRWFIRGIATPG